MTRLIRGAIGFGAIVALSLLPGCAAAGGSSQADRVDPADYFPTDAGRHLVYDFTTDGHYTAGTRYITFQERRSGYQSSYLYAHDLATNAGFGFANFTSGGNWYIQSHQVTGCCDHRGFHYFVRLPDVITAGAAYRSGEIEFRPRLEANAAGFDDVLVIEFTSAEDDFSGTGALFLARDVGIVRIDFSHTTDGRFGDAGEGFRYELVRSSSASLGTLSGTVVDAQGDPVEDAIVTVGATTPTLADRFGAVRTDAAGAFAYPIYWMMNAPITAIVAGVEDVADPGTRTSASLQNLIPSSAAQLDLGSFEIPLN